MTEDLASILGEPRPEKRQCLLKSIAAALLDGAETPTGQAVVALASELRLELDSQARAAEGALGPAPAPRHTHRARAADPPP